MNSGFKRLIVKEVKEELRGFKIISFEPNKEIDFKAGQYLTFVKDDERRSYSIISAPSLQEPLTIGVKRQDNGYFSRYLVDDVKEGDELVTTGAAGFFTLPEQDINLYHQLFFFAAGSGITPVYSLIKEALNAFSHLSIILIYSNASVEKTIFREELLALQDEYKERFVIEFLYSNVKDLRRARLHRELIFSILTSYSTGSARKILYYLCGPESYLRLCIYSLQEKGIAAEQIKREHFFIPPRPKIELFPPDKETHNVTIQYGQDHLTFAVPFPDTILKAAKNAGINLPFSCEAGVCGNCAARCLSGKVWHSYNEVLTEKELNQGLVLTCVGHPVGGDVALEIR